MTTRDPLLPQRLRDLGTALGGFGATNAFEMLHETAREVEALRNTVDAALDHEPLMRLFDPELVKRVLALPSSDRYHVFEMIGAIKAGDGIALRDAGEMEKIKLFMSRIYAEMQVDGFARLVGEREAMSR